MVFQTAGQSLYWLKGFVQLGNVRLQLQRFPCCLEPTAHAGKQHEPQLQLGVLQDCVYFTHRELQPFGGRAQVSGLQDGLNHFDMT